MNHLLEKVNGRDGIGMDAVPGNISIDILRLFQEDEEGGNRRRHNRMQDTEKYLRPTPSIDCDNESIKQKADDLTKGQEKDLDKAKSLFYFVRDEIKYNPIPLDFFEGYRASKTLEKREGFCVEKASLLAAWEQLYGLESRERL